MERAGMHGRPAGRGRARVVKRLQEAGEVVDMLGPGARAGAREVAGKLRRRTELLKRWVSTSCGFKRFFARSLGKVTAAVQ